MRWSVIALCLLPLAGCLEDAGTDDAVVGPEVPEPTVELFNASLEESGTLTAGTGIIGLGCGNGAEGMDYVLIPFDVSASPGKVSMVADLILGDSNVDSNLILIDAAGEQVAYSGDFNALTGGGEHLETEGAVPPGTYTFRVEACIGAQMDYKLVATAEEVPEPEEPVEEPEETEGTFFGA